jgi:RecB family exonuclease
MKNPVSYSGLGTYDECPRKFKRKYIDKEEVKQPPTPETAPKLFRGTRVHKEIELFLKGEAECFGKECESFKNLIHELKEIGAQAEVEFCLSNDWEIQDFDAEEGLLRGVIDVVDVRDGEKEGRCYDWKTGKIYDSHSDQRALYALALFIKYPELESIVSTSVYLDQKKQVSTTYSRANLTAYKWVWERRVNKTRPPQMYPMRPSWKCKFCDYSKLKGGKCPNPK